MEIDEIWRKTLKILKNTVNSIVGYNVHIKSAVPFSLKNSVFTISVPMALNKNMIEFRYKDYIESSLEQVTGEKLTLNIIIDGEEEDTTPFEETLPSENTVNPKYTFENFVVGSSNEYAAAAAISATEKPGYIYNPLFLYGNSGLGKTHLMHAIGNKIKENHKDYNIIYVSSERFTNEFVNSLKDHTNADFKKKYRSADVLLIDDVQFIEKKEATQEEFFHTFNDLYSMNKQIVLTSDRKPVDLVTLEERLRTRFSQGLTIDITIPNYETRVAILKKKAEVHNVNIADDVLGYIADRIKSNIRELEGALLKIISISEISHKPIDIPLAEYVLGSILPKDGIVQITPDKIMDKVAVFYNIKKDDLIGKVKTSNIALPRQIAMYLCNTLTDMNPKMIGNAFGGKDRSTVIHNVKKIKTELSKNEALKSDINYIIKDLESI